MCNTCIPPQTHVGAQLRRAFEIILYLYIFDRLILRMNDALEGKFPGRNYKGCWKYSFAHGIKYFTSRPRVLFLYNSFFIEFTKCNYCLIAFIDWSFFKQRKIHWLCPVLSLSRSLIVILQICMNAWIHGGWAEGSCPVFLVSLIFKFYYLTSCLTWRYRKKNIKVGIEERLYNHTKTI